MVTAFIEGRTKTSGNNFTDGKTLFLHGNPIAKRAPEAMGGIYVTLAGWATPTTKERLNGLLDLVGLKDYPRHVVGIHQAKHIQYLGSHCGNPSLPDHKEWSMEMDPNAWYFVPFDGSQAVQVLSPEAQTIEA